MQKQVIALNKKLNVIEIDFVYVQTDIYIKYLLFYKLCASDFS